MISRLMVEVIHLISEEFKEHAILKGGVELALFTSHRATNDIDFVFIPYKSKKEIEPKLTQLLKDDGLTVTREMHSKMIRYIVGRDGERIQIEVNVEVNVPSEPISTAAVSSRYGISPRVIRIMSPNFLLANKIAAWNERRLIRDLYDICYLYTIQRVKPDLKQLLKRLSKIESRIPRFKNRKKMAVETLCLEIEEFSNKLTSKQIEQELGGFLPASELEGLERFLSSQTLNFTAWLRTTLAGNQFT